MKTKEAKRMIDISRMMIVVIVMILVAVLLALPLGYFNYYITMFTLIAALEMDIISLVIECTYSKDLYFTEEAQASSFIFVRVVYIFLYEEINHLNIKGGYTYV